MGLSRQHVLGFAALYAAYCEARRRVLKHAEKTGTRIGPKWLGLLAWNLLYGWSRLVGVKLASEGGPGLELVDPARRYLIVWHPHGFIAWSALFIVSKMAITKHPHGKEWFAMVAPALFRLPIFSEALMLVNGRKVDKPTVENLLAKGASIAIQPGGVREQIVTTHDQEQAVFPANLGFIRMAIKHGLELLPVYIFNENQLYKRVEGFDKSSEWIYKNTGFGTPALTGKANLPMNMILPRAADVHVRWGVPIEAGLAEESPSDDRVEELFAKYLLSLQSLFDTYKDECLPPEVAARGLKIVRLDGKPLPELKRSLPTAAADAVEPSVVTEPANYMTFTQAAL